MNTQSGTSQALPQHSIFAADPAQQDQQLASAVELWEPPFERWLRLADDLLRDWPGTGAGQNRI